MKLHTIKFIAIFLTQLAPVGVAQADEYPFGRVFTTPAEREQIDTAATGVELIEESNGNSEKTGEINPGVAHRPQVVTFSGVLIDDNGKATAWVEQSGTGLQEKHVSFGSDIKQKEEIKRLKVTVNNNGKYKRVKPGQKWIVDEDTVKEAYQATSQKLEQSPINTDLADENSQTQHK